jgi:hypothetical protein
MIFSDCHQKTPIGSIFINVLISVALNTYGYYSGPGLFSVLTTMLGLVYYNTKLLILSFVTYLDWKHHDFLGFVECEVNREPFEQLFLTTLSISTLLTMLHIFDLAIQKSLGVKTSSSGFIMCVYASLAVAILCSPILMIRGLFYLIIFIAFSWPYIWILVITLPIIALYLYHYQRPMFEDIFSFTREPASAIFVLTIPIWASTMVEFYVFSKIKSGDEVDAKFTNKQLILFSTYVLTIYIILIYYGLVSYIYRYGHQNYINSLSLDQTERMSLSLYYSKDWTIASTFVKL